MLNMEYFDIVLFSPPSRMLNHYRPPLGLLYLGGYLTSQGLRVKIIDVPIKEQVRNRNFRANSDLFLKNIHIQMIEDFKKTKTKVVGITCYSTEVLEVQALVTDIKKAKPDVKIIIGGIHATLEPEDFFNRIDDVDICVIGEGEITLYELIKRILINPETDISDIKGIVFRDKLKKKVVHTPLNILEKKLDDISLPDYNLIDMEYYTNASPYSIRGCYLRSMYILATRGCPSQCTFCVAKKLREFSSDKNAVAVRARSAESLIKEIKKLKEKYKIDSFYFIDDLFTINKENVSEFCNKLKVEKLNLLWGCSSKVTTLDEELVREMSQAGCIQIDFGVERGSDEALKLLKKGITVSKIVEVFDLCHKYGIRTLANMLVNIPGETEKDLSDILNLLNRIRSEVTYLNIFAPYPGTEIYEHYSNRFDKEDYLLLAQDMKTLIKAYPEKFKFAEHNIDLHNWLSTNYNKYNPVLRNLAFYVSPKYLKVLIKSERKVNYLMQFYMFVSEFINQKFSAI